MPSTPTYDVCVIGSGAAGGMVTKTLCESGAKVILLEAGKEVKPTEYHSHCWPYELQFRNLRGEKQEPFYPPDIKNTIRFENSDSVGVDRIRVLGGRTVHWNAVVLRYSANDFRERSLQGIEEDWPISYEELAPYYEQVEQMIGVCGNDDGIEMLPSGKHYLPPLPFRCSEHLLKKGCASIGVPVIATRRALLTKAYDKRPACHYCGHCMDGCDVAAIYSSTGSTLPKARATGNLTLRQNALAREILVDSEGLARAVSIVDRVTKQEEEIKAKVIVLCCATIESARLLLNSKSPRHPGGLANSSGVVGRYLHGHLGSSLHVFLDDLVGMKPFNDDGALDHALIPRWRKEPDGAYDFQINFDGRMIPHHAKRIPGYGADYKNTVRRMQPAALHLAGFAKVFAKAENRVTVDPKTLDPNGIPIPVVQFRFDERDAVLHKALQKSAMEIAGSVKGKIISDFGDKPGGFASHECGTVRMGSNPRTSALNSFNQAHDCKNLFVTDGSSFVTSAEKNPTLTIMALSVRAAEHIAELRKKGEL